jgi:hypothetical protein
MPRNTGCASLLKDIDWEDDDELQVGKLLKETVISASRVIEENRKNPWDIL